MSEVQKSVISYKSANGISNVSGYIYRCESVTAKAVLQISHGMCEYIGRYSDFAEFMARQGYVVCGNDHIGHGKTSDSENSVDGYFANQDGWQCILHDLHRMNGFAQSHYPGLPVILLGHSMGSFFARLYAVTYPETINALILSGTGGPNPLGSIGIKLTKLISRLKGDKHRSNLVQAMAFGSYLKKIDKPSSPYDWISRDKEIVEAYIKDKKCTSIFTVSAFGDLMHVLNTVNTPQWAQKLNKEMPVFIFSGDMDPVGDYGKGVLKVEQFIKDAGVQDVTLKLYDGGRHEMLNETNRQEVYTDVLEWCNSHLNKAIINEDGEN